MSRSKNTERGRVWKHGMDAYTRWPVPSWYKRLTEDSERAHGKRVVQKLKEDVEAEPQPRKHKKDNSYYW